MDLAFIRNRVDTWLTRMPQLYAKLLRMKCTYNQEKYVYLNLILNGDAVVEAGANVGYFTKLFANIIGKRGQLHAFEPTPSTFLTLEDNCTKAKLPHPPRLNRFGLSDHNGEATIYLPEKDCGQASLVPHHIGSWVEETSPQLHTITLTTLDKYTQENGLTRLDFFKLDIEGAEFLALKGGKETLKHYTPLIHMEVCTHFLRDFGVTTKELIHFLENLGYDRFLAYEEDMNKPKDLGTLSEEALNKSHNIVCASSAKHAERLSRLGWI